MDRSSRGNDDVVETVTVEIESERSPCTTLRQCVDDGIRELGRRVGKRHEGRRSVAVCRKREITVAVMVEVAGGKAVDVDATAQRDRNLTPEGRLIRRRLVNGDSNQVVLHGERSDGDLVLL